MAASAALTLSLPSSIAAHISVGLAGAVLVLALLFGGGTTQGLWSDALIQIASLPLLALGMWQLLQRALPRTVRGAVILAGAIVVLPLLQLIPLSPNWWGLLSGHAPIAAAYDAVGIARPWLPISLTPAATGLSALSLLPPLAIFIATLRLDHDDRRTLILFVLGIVLLGIVIEFLQVMQGSKSPLYFYAVTNWSNGVGFFANRNHEAALLYSAVPLATAAGLSLSRRRPQQRHLGLLLVGLVIAGAVLGLAMTTSRAGFALAALAGLFCVALVGVHRNRRPRRRRVLVALGCNLAALVVAFQFGFVTLSGRVENGELIDDIRWPVAATTAAVAIAYSPLGSGFGSFVPVFQAAEPPRLLATYYVNHAHDDWLEIWLDGGLPAVLLAAAFLLWLGRAAFVVWRTRPAPDARTDLSTPGRAGSIVILLLLLHSVVDYPLRTAALMCLFALSAALLIDPLESAESDGNGRSDASGGDSGVVARDSLPEPASLRARVENGPDAVSA